MKMYRRKVSSILFFVFLVSSATGITVLAVSEPSGKEKHRKDIVIFGSDNIMEITLNLDLKSYLKKDFKDPMDAELVIHTGENDSVNLKVKISSRGNYRSTECNYPPLELSFSKPVQAYPGFGKIKKMKLYTCCETGGIYNEYILREFLVYRFFNAITDSSYRVRLLAVNLADSQGKKKTLKQFGFFLEPKELLAERLESAEIENVKQPVKQISRESYDRLAIFNYMVSNYDWSVKEQHNVSVFMPLKNNASGSYIAVPHDFDGTGVVNAIYSMPVSKSSLKSIRERTFLGVCRSRELFYDDMSDFLSKKKEIYSMVKEFTELNQISKKDITDFLDQFYNQLEKKSSLDNLIDNFMKNCKN
jgi:hypothetical protein